MWTNAYQAQSISLCVIDQCFKFHVEMRDRNAPLHVGKCRDYSVDVVWRRLVGLLSRYVFWPTLLRYLQFEVHVEVHGRSVELRVDCRRGFSRYVFCRSPERGH